MPHTTDPTLIKIVNERPDPEDTLWSDIVGLLSRLINLNSE